MLAGNTVSIGRGVLRYVVSCVCLLKALFFYLSETFENSIRYVCHTAEVSLSHGRSANSNRKQPPHAFVAQRLCMQGLTSMSLRSGALGVQVSTDVGAFVSLLLALAFDMPVSSVG